MITQRQRGVIRRMPCKETERLLSRYAVATGKLFEAVSGISAGVEFDQKWEEAEAAHAICSELRRNLYSHIAQHSCGLTIVQELIEKPRSNGRIVSNLRLWERAVRKALVVSFPARKSVGSVSFR